MELRESDMALTSRVRLARNYKDIPFPPRMDEAWAQESIQRTQKALRTGEVGKTFETQRMKDIPFAQRMRLVERHRISPALVEKADVSAVILSPEQDVSIMVNEEDHLRIQTFLPGLSLIPCWEKANQIDDQIEATAQYAFDPELGYLTTCPTNTGTGLRGSIMLHLPVLTKIGQINPIAQAVSKVGLTVRGWYGEGSEALGCLYQLSNQVTMGKTEMDILESLAATARQVIAREWEVRRRIYAQNKIEVEDRLMRSYGLLRHARKMDTKEFMRLLSDVRLAVDVGLLNSALRPKIDRLMEEMQPASLTIYGGGEMDKQARDALRAQVVREAMQDGDA